MFKKIVIKNHVESYRSSIKRRYYNQLIGNSMYFLTQKLQFRLKMGNNISSQNQSLKHHWAQHQQLVKTPGCPKLLISIDNAFLHAEKYKFLIGKDALQKEESILNKRMQSHQNLVGVYSYQVAEKVLGCTNQSLINVVTQRIPFRLSDLYKIKISFEQMLFILREAVKGYQILHKLNISSIFNATMIGINNIGQIKVWINQNFGKNTTLGSHNISQQSNLDNILKTVMESTEILQQQNHFKVDLLHRLNKCNISFKMIQQIINGQRINQIICKEKLSWRLHSLVENKISNTNANDARKRAASQQLIKKKDNTTRNAQLYDSQYGRSFQRKHYKAYSDISRVTTPKNIFMKSNRINNVVLFSPRGSHQPIRPIKCSLNYKQPTKIEVFHSRRSTDNEFKQNLSKITVKNIHNARKRNQQNQSKTYNFESVNKIPQNKRLLTVIDNNLSKNQIFSKMNIISACKTANHKGSVRIQTEISPLNFQYQNDKCRSEQNTFASSRKQGSTRRNEIQKTICFPLSSTNKLNSKKQNENLEFLETIFKKSNSSKNKKLHPLSIISQDSMNLNLNSIKNKSQKEDKNIQTQQFVLQLMKQQSKLLLQKSDAASQLTPVQAQNCIQSKQTSNNAGFQKPNQSDISVEQGKLFLDLFKYYLGSDKKEESSSMDQKDKQICNNLFSDNHQQYQDLQSMDCVNNETRNNQKLYQVDSYSGLQTIQQETENEQCMISGSHSAYTSAAKSC